MLLKAKNILRTPLNLTVVLIKLSLKNLKTIKLSNLRKKFLNNIDFFAKNNILLKV